jgi:molybdate transport system permease protein
MRAFSPERPGGSPATAGRPALIATADLGFVSPGRRAFARVTGKQVRIKIGKGDLPPDCKCTIQMLCRRPSAVLIYRAGPTRGGGAHWRISRLAVPPQLMLPRRATPLTAVAEGRTRFAIANPQHAPYGQAAREVLERLGLWQRLQPALVLGENASQAMQFAASGSCQGGIVPLSLASAPDIVKLGAFERVPWEWHAPLRQRMVLVTRAGPVASAFYDYVQRDEGAGRTLARFASRPEGSEPAGGGCDPAVARPGRLTSPSCCRRASPCPVAGTARFAGRHWSKAAGAALALPPTVLGYYLLVAMGGTSSVGRWFQAATGTTLAFSFTGLVLASLLFNLPFAVQPIQRAIEAIDPDVREAALCCGMTPWQTLLRIELPLAWPGILSAAVLTFAHTLGEFGVVLMVGGNIPGETRTVALAIYDRAQSFDAGAAGSMALLLLAVSFVTIAVSYGLGSRLPGTRRRR